MEWCNKCFCKNAEKFLLNAIIGHLFVVFTFIRIRYCLIFNESCKIPLKSPILLREKAQNNPKNIFFVANIWGKMEQIQA
jgi:hypothetical protein